MSQKTKMQRENKMNPYLDILDFNSYDSINLEGKEKPKPKDNDTTIGKISLILIIAFVAYMIWTIIDAYAYGESDFVLEMSNASTMNEKLTFFAIEGESYRGGICPSGQCNLEGNIDPSFSPPNPGNPSMSFGVDFILKDNVPNPSIGPNEKAYLERFSLSNYCRVDDIIEDNGQENYTCHNGSTTITRTFDSRSWDYNNNLIYDAKKNTLRAVGNYTGNSRR